LPCALYNPLDMPRAYNLGLRLAAAEQTRSRIIDAARQILSDDDFGGLSIDAIARRAGVARMTVYYQFSSRHGLLEALYDDLAARGLTDNLPRMTEERDPFEALNRLIEVFCYFWASDRLIVRRLRGLLVIDKEIEAGIRERESRRKQQIASLLHQIEKERGWRAPVTIDEASSLIMTLSNFETYDTITPEDGKPEDTARLLKNGMRAILGIEE